jgi:hypothetical protein
VNVVTVHQEKKLLATSGVDDYAILWEPVLISKANLAETNTRAEQVRTDEEEAPPIRLGCSVM